LMGLFIYWQHILKVWFIFYKPGYPNTS
jgi:hypothetical protein